MSPVRVRDETGPEEPAGADLELYVDGFIRQRLGPDTQDLYAETHRQLDRILLPQVLEYTCGNQDQAARLLGIALHTLRQKLRDLGLQVTHAGESDKDERA
jgi:DNA-binding protein Fis